MESGGQVLNYGSQGLNFHRLGLIIGSEVIDQRMENSDIVS